MDLKTLRANLQSAKKYLGSAEFKKLADNVIDTKLQPRVMRRIFELGRDASNKLIGKYSAQPIYISVSKYPMFASSLKPYRKKFKTAARGRPRLSKSAFFSNGYKAFRKAVGRQNTKVDLNLTGKTKQAVSIVRKGNKVTFAIRTKKAREILDGNERRFSKRIIDFTNSEIKFFSSELGAKVQKVISRIIKKGKK